MNEKETTQNEYLPVYNIKAVSHLVGLLPVTLRAWERRYGLPKPSRGDQGYRLYSEHDLRTLRWLKNQIESGLSIGRAVEYLSDLRQADQDPALSPTPPPPFSLKGLSSSPSLQHLRDELLHHLLHFDESSAVESLRRGFTLYYVDQVLIHVIAPALVEIGDRWHRGEVPIATEHFSTQFCMQYLMSLMAASAPPTRPGLIVAACAPGETHQIGILMLVVMLRWRGWDVKYLGPDLPLDRLEEAIGPMHPTLIMFTANRIETAQRLNGLAEIIKRFPSPRPLVVVGGQAFNSMRLPEAIPIIYINRTPAETIQTLEYLLFDQYKPNNPLESRSKYAEE